MAARIIGCVFFFLVLGFASSAPKVQLALYFESLCLACRQFILEQLYPTYEKIGQIFDLTLVPYGNANESKHGAEWRFECQHGKEECVGNMIETCALHILNVSLSFPFVHCFEKNIVRDDKVVNPLSVAKQCAEDLDVDFTAIEKCQNEPLGNRLEHEMAVKTEALRPQLQYVPWVTVNGQHTEKMQDKAESHLLELVCEYYTGPKPAACGNTRGGRCYREPFAHA